MCLLSPTCMYIIFVSYGQLFQKANDCMGQIAPGFASGYQFSKNSLIPPNDLSFLVCQVQGVIDPVTYVFASFAVVLSFICSSLWIYYSWCHVQC